MTRDRDGEGMQKESYQIHRLKFLHEGHDLSHNVDWPVMISASTDRYCKILLLAHQMNAVLCVQVNLDRVEVKYICILTGRYVIFCQFSLEATESFMHAILSPSMMTFGIPISPQKVALMMNMNDENWRANLAQNTALLRFDLQENFTIMGQAIWDSHGCVVPSLMRERAVVVVCVVGRKLDLCCRVVRRSIDDQNWQFSSMLRTESPHDTGDHGEFRFVCLYAYLGVILLVYTCVTEEAQFIVVDQFIVPIDDPHEEDEQPVLLHCHIRMKLCLDFAFDLHNEDSFHSRVAGTPVFTGERDLTILFAHEDMAFLEPLYLRFCEVGGGFEDMNQPRFQPFETPMQVPRLYPTSGSPFVVGDSIRFMFLSDSSPPQAVQMLVPIQLQN